MVYSVRVEAFYPRGAAGGTCCVEEVPGALMSCYCGMDCRRAVVAALCSPWPCPFSLHVGHPSPGNRSAAPPSLLSPLRAPARSYTPAYCALPKPVADPKELAELRERVRARYPVAQFAAARARLDPKNIMGNRLVDALLR